MLPLCITPCIPIGHLVKSRVNFSIQFDLSTLPSDDADVAEFCCVLVEDVKSDVEAAVKSMNEYNATMRAKDPFAAAMTELPCPDMENWLLFDAGTSDIDYTGVFATLE